MDRKKFCVQKKCKVRKKYWVCKNCYKKKIVEVVVEPNKTSANISEYSALFCYFFQQECPWDWVGGFAYQKPYELNKMGDQFFMDFLFWGHRLFKEMPDAFKVCGIDWLIYLLKIPISFNKTLYVELKRDKLGLRWTKLKL